MEDWELENFYGAGIRFDFRLLLFVLHLGVFSSRTEAEAVKAAAGLDYGVEEYTLDEMVGHQLLPCFKCHVHLPSGNATVFQERLTALCHPANGLIHRPTSISVEAFSPISTEHAVKLATEYRQAWLRETSKVPDAPQAQEI